MKKLLHMFKHLNLITKVPKLLKSENVSDKNLQEVFKCIGIKFIKKLLNNSTFN